MSDEAWLDEQKRHAATVDRARDPQWRAELLDLLAELVAELGRLRVAVEVLAGEALDRQIEREAREASIEAHPSLGIDERGSHGE